jgi:hypothetical protein
MATNDKERMLCYNKCRVTIESGSDDENATGSDAI